MSRLRKAIALSTGVLQTVFFLPVLYAEPISAPAMAPTSEIQSPRAISKGENVKVMSYEVELGKTLSIPVPNTGFHLNNAPAIASVSSITPSGIVVNGVHMGETMILVWTQDGVRSFRVVVTRPTRETRLIEKTLEENSKLFKSREARSFKAFYDSSYSLLNQDRVFARVSESSKVHDHRGTLQGATPYGDFKGSLLYEYRKEHAMEKSVSVPRDMWAGLFDTDLPYLQHYDVIGGEQYVNLGDFGFPGERYSGVTLLPSESRLRNPEAGQINSHFLLGSKRDGSIIDNPPSSQNRGIRGNVVGEKFDYYLWKEGKVSLGSFHQWNGPRTSLQSRSNYDMQMDFKIPYLRLRGEGGLDNRGNPAFQIKPSISHKWGRIEGRWFSVDNQYATTSGSTIDRGNRGYQLSTGIYPLMPFWESDRVFFDGQFGWVRNRLSSNPDCPGDFVKTSRGTLTVKLPYGVRSETGFVYDNRVAMTFPYVQKKISEKIVRDFNFKNPWLKRTRLYATGTLDAFRKADNSPGFNSTRGELGGGGAIYLAGGFWVGSKFLWNELDEKEPSTSPSRITHPHQTTVEGGWNYSFRKLPLSINYDVRYLDEARTYGKIHQPFLNEDRFEMRGGFNWNIQDIGTLFVQLRSAIVQSTIGNPEQAELSLYGGFRMRMDTHLYIPQRGLIEGTLYEDRNGNGVQDPGEPGVMGQEISIENGPKAMTDRNGYFSMKVWEGKVKLLAPNKIPDGYFFTTPNWHEIEILPKSKFVYDFGIAPQIQIKGHVFIDVNGNQIYEKGDIPVSGIQIVLDSGQMAISAEEGFYSILRVGPGSNKVRVALGSLPSGYKTLTAVEKTFDGTPGDILNFNVILAAQRNISGYVFEDRNGNGQFEPGEKGIANAEVTIEGKIYKTNRNGKYFAGDLKPGDYKIQLNTKTLPEGAAPEMTERQVHFDASPASETSAHFPLKVESEVSE